MSTLESFACPGCNASMSWHEGVGAAAGYWLCNECDVRATDHQGLTKATTEADPQS